MRLHARTLKSVLPSARALGAAAVAAGLALGPVAPVLGGSVAVAAPKGCPPGLAKQGRCAEKGYGHDHRHEERRRWARGDHAPRDRYVIIDGWRDRGLAPPPRGHVYVRMDGELFLIATATSLIVDILANN
ncbi:RcnB family protein [Rhodovulum sp. DZ06]|uniref:RcnB family protein n=1 Tax=Rhodovulum sp. DZ06 TaxID=3425126 RepID=UPI003D32AB08